MACRQAALEANLSTVLDQYAVVGHPVAHSRSPEIHASFAQATGQNLHYGRIDPGPEGLSAAVQAFRQQGGRGLNITLPFKEQALTLANQLSARARLAGAANTLCFHDHQIEADNTDGAGLVQDLSQNLNWPLAGASVLILGAGGAARGVVAPLLEAGVAQLVIANRNPQRAKELLTHLHHAGLPPSQGQKLAACALTEIPQRPYDLIINATSGGHGGALPTIAPQLLAATPRVYDLSYGAAAQPFLEFARAMGVRQCADGLGMLIEQAAESFRLWRGVRPDTAPLLSRMRSSQQG
jgi:shikimate dehydrogenase